MIPETFKPFYIKCKNRLLRFYFTRDKQELIAEVGVALNKFDLLYNPWELPIDLLHVCCTYESGQGLLLNIKNRWRIEHH